MGLPVVPLHEFMAANRAKIVRTCVDRIRGSAAPWESDDLEEGFGIVYDQVMRAVQREAGLETSSPLPDGSEAAAVHGGQRQARGDHVARLAKDFGCISDSVGALAGAEDLSFRGREYHAFNQALDSAIAASLERYWDQAQEQVEADRIERMGTLAHELRNALSSARTAFAVLRRGQLGLASRTGDVLDRSLARLDALVTQALLAVRLEASVESPARSTVPVRRLLREVADAAVPERGIRLRIESDEDLYARADELLLVSAVSNLVQNALKFSRPDTEVVLRTFHDERGSITIEVEDGCGGLPPGKVDEMFAPFVRKSSDGRGLGLGLAITRDAVLATGGELSVRDLPGKGCVFAVRVPAAERSDE